MSLESIALALRGLCGVSPDMHGSGPRRRVVLALALAAIPACAVGVPRPVEVRPVEISLPAQKARVFDAALAAGQELNLNVAVLERSSGLIRFERASMDASQLQEYCEYPLVNSRTGWPWDTFTKWNVRSVQGRSGSVTGSVSLTLLMTESGGATNLNIRANFIAGNLTERHECTSQGVIEDKIVSKIQYYVSQ